MRIMGECDTHRINASVEGQNSGSTEGHFSIEMVSYPGDHHFPIHKFPTL